MNKRQLKKRNKKVDMWVGLDMTPFRCQYCANYESGDMSVGMLDGCVADYLYDDNGDLQDDKNEKITEYMQRKGWTCPHFCRNKKAKGVLKAPRSYKEIKRRIKTEEEYYKQMIESNRALF